MIIGISGYSGSGKDTLGAIIQYLNCYNVGDLTIDEILKDYISHEWWLEEQSGWEVKKFAGKLKQIASLLTGVEVAKFEDQEFKKLNLGPEWSIHGMPMTYRELLQKLGTDGLRNGLHYNVWVNALFADYKCVPADRAPKGWDCDNWVITDVRFPNEAKAIKDRGGIIIRVDRPFCKPVNNHPSEVSLDNWNFDYKIANVSDLTSLSFTIQIILEELNILKAQHEGD
jgi:hypothetical protein